MSLNFCFLGAGNLATHLASALHQKCGNVLQVYSRSEDSAKMLAEMLGTDYTARIEDITKDADVYFIALKDSAVSEVLSGVDFQNKPLVHCSGSLPLSALESFSARIGVLYPLQTFSKKRSVNFDEIPVFVESNDLETLHLLQQIGQCISSKVNELDSEKRKSLHIAAVFACNFVNHFYNLAARFLESKEIDFDALHPLIMETAKKAIEMDPADAQTGPAVRYDENIINDHLSALNDYPQLKELYSSISKSIFEHHQKK